MRGQRIASNAILLQQTHVENSLINEKLKLQNVEYLKL